ncbi:MAG: PIG-L family deacetylase [Ktedonobacterales bacterium]|nr:PIG-L family deacetylase [Ktedonobacterales bacterium]
MQLTALDHINQQYRQIYFQPHFDDAILSAGGSMRLQTATGQRVLVVTVFGGVPPAGTPLGAFAAQNHQRMGLGSDATEAVRRRREEDRAAVESLGADVFWLDYPDAIYRGTPPLYQNEESLFGDISAGDLALDEELASVFLAIYERAPLAALYAPMGIGHHVDHQLCCSAADRLAQRKLNVKFYEDFPYVRRQGALEARQRELGIQMEPELVEVSGTMRAKQEAIQMYTSQVPMLFGSEEEMITGVGHYAATLRRAYPGIQIERFWRW